MSKVEKVYEELKEAGAKSVLSFHLQKVGGWRYSARIGDLKKQGYEILSVTEKAGGVRGCRYFLVDYK